MATRIDEQLETLLSAADAYFFQIAPSLSNREILSKTLQIPDLSDKVVEVLVREESADNWPLQDSDLQQFIALNCTKYNLPLPAINNQLKRWFSLIYMAASILKGFSYGNVVRAEDITG